MPTDFSARLRSSRLRVTASRLAVHDALNAFSHAGLARQLDPSVSSAARYEPQGHDNHHHLFCRQCRRIQDVRCVTGSAPCLAPADASGFIVDEADITFWGTCSECQSAAEENL